MRGGQQIACRGCKGQQHHKDEGLGACGLVEAAFSFWRHVETIGENEDLGNGENAGGGMKR